MAKIICTPKVKHFWGAYFMSKKGQKQKRYSAEFKAGVIMDMREHRLSYHKTVRKHYDTKSHSEKCNYINNVKRWERIYL